MSLQSAVTSRTLADRFGLHPTDLECLDLILRREETTPGVLAKTTGLTTGAVTAVVDRLETAGLVKRVPDPVDRRRHLIRIEAPAVVPIRTTLEPMQAEISRLWSEYDAHDLAVIADFLSRSTDLAARLVDRIAREAPVPTGKRPLARMSRRASPKALANTTSSDLP